MIEFSPSGGKVVPSVGPLDAEIVLIAESPASEEVKQGIPLVGASGQMLNKALVHAGIDRAKCYIMNCVPVRAPGDKFAAHSLEDISWARARFNRELSSCSAARVYIPLGANPTSWLLQGQPPVVQRGEGKREGFISAWRGSVLPVTDFYADSGRPEDYLYKTGLKPLGNSFSAIIPTFHPAAVLRQFQWHSWFLQDIKKAAFVASNGIPSKTYRKWYRDDPYALARLADSDVNLISVDSELEPWIIGIASDEEVHVFEWDERYRKALTKLMTRSNVLKIAHRWLHDYAFFRKCLNIDIEWPIFDSVGGAFALNTALQKELSPHIATKFTNWAYHKWLSNLDQLHYCGMDSVVAYDSYWPMLQQLCQKGFVVPASLDGKLGITDYDHKLLQPLVKMQGIGFKIDESARLSVAAELSLDLLHEESKLANMVEPVIEKEIKRFKKPHLFRKLVKCTCCGGGKTQREHCRVCSLGPTIEPTKAEALGRGFKTIKALKEAFVACDTCNATGKVVKKLEFNSDSSDQLADVVYRGLHIRPRKYKQSETVRAAQLEPLAEKHPIVAQIVATSGVRAEYDTVARLKAGSDGLLHCEFDPWGTGSGRVASKEGLIEAGTNAQNLPRKARRFIVPRDGFSFVYPDLAQVEARCMAVLSGDKNLWKALYEPIPEIGRADYHTWLLRAIHEYDGGLSISRDQSKRVSYAGFYGARASQLAKELDAEALRKGTGMRFDSAKAQQVLDVLYRVCPEVPRWQQSVADEVLRSRKLVSPTGRVFSFAGYIVGDKADEIDYEIKKQIWSRLPQDMGAYVLGQGLIDLYYNSNEWGKLVTPIIHCHDALLIEVPNDRVQDAEALAVKTLSRYIWSMHFPAESKEVTNRSNWYVVS